LLLTKRGAEGFQITGLLPGVVGERGVGIAFKVMDGDPSRMNDKLEFSARVRPAVTLEILRFNHKALKLLDDPEGASVTLREFLDANRFSLHFRERYLYPMASAVWSTSLAQIGHFPAATLIRFFHNHGTAT